MSSYTSISVADLDRLLGTPEAAAVLDVRVAEDFAADPRLLPASLRRGHEHVSNQPGEFGDRPVVVVCRRGQKLSQGAAAWLRHEGVDARALTGGFEAWREAGLPLIPAAAIPARDDRGRTVWVTRERPKIDRIACPWLIRRFVDPGAVILFVEAAEVQAVADRFAATPFDIDGVFWSHRGERCTFDTMLDEFGLHTQALDRLATIVRGADTARPDLAPEAPGLLAVSLGLSRMIGEDLRQLDAGMLLYDALHRWCRDATQETHNWPAQGGSGGDRTPA
jgi:rhodanese-related sulfurtransferase